MNHANYAGQAAQNSLNDVGATSYSSGIVGAGTSKLNKPIVSPDTFRGVLERLEALTKKAASVSGHAADARIRICGTFPEPGETRGDYPSPVPNGILEEMQHALNALEQHLRLADDHLEMVWSKVS